MRMDDIESILDYYDDCKRLRETAHHFRIDFQTVRRILITFGNYKDEKSLLIRSMLDKGMTVQDISNTLDVSSSAVFSYMPYQKGMYKMDDASRNAQNIRRHRERKRSNSPGN